VLADESRKQASVNVIASASAVADDEVDPLAAVEVRHVGGSRHRCGAKQRCGSKRRQDCMAHHEYLSVTATA
jgi:hypothetical protein